MIRKLIFLLFITSFCYAGNPHYPFWLEHNVDGSHKDYYFVTSYGADPTGVSDSYSAIQTVLDAVNSAGGGIVFLPDGTYLTSDKLTMYTNTSLIGIGKFESIIEGAHTGASVLSLKGANHCYVHNVQIKGNATTIPKTGICCGRSGAGTAGLHLFDFVSTTGSFSKAAVYLIASESNTHQNCYYQITGGTGQYAVYTSQSDSLSVDSMTGSTNNLNVFYNCEIHNANDVANCSALYMQTVSATSMWSFRDSYFVAPDDAYITIDVGTVSATDCDGAIIFDNCSAEKTGAGDVTYGILVTATGTRKLQDLRVTGNLFGVSGGSDFAIYVNDNITLENPTIECMFPEAVSFYNVTGGRIVLPESNITVRNNITDSYVEYDSGTYALTVTGNATMTQVVDWAGKRAVGTAAPVVELHNVVNAGRWITEDTAANSTAKYGRWGIEHYSVAEEPFYSIFPAVTNGSNTLNIGGGTSIGNAATSIDFYAAANSTTTTGTKMMELNTTGLGIQTADPNHPLDVDGTVQAEKYLHRSITVTAAGPTDNLDVDDADCVLINTNGNNVTIGGFTNGDAGQILFVCVIDATNNATLEHAEGTGNQDIYLSDGADETITAGYGGWLLQFDGTHWRECTVGGGGNVEDDVFGAGWNGDGTNAPSQNAVHDYIVQVDADLDGDFTDELWFPGGGVTPWDDIANPDADDTIALTGYEVGWTSTLDEAAHVAMTLSNTDADIANAITLFKILGADSDETNVTYFHVADAGGDIFKIVGITTNIGADDNVGHLVIHDAGTITLYDDSDDTSVVLGPVGDGTTVLSVTGTVNATGLQVGGTAVAVSGGAFHDGFSDFVANEHIDHSGVTLSAGIGLSGGGDISANRSFAVDLSELTGNQTWNDGATDASFTLTFNLNAGSDPVLTVGDGIMNLTTGVWQIGGSTVYYPGGTDVADADVVDTLTASNYLPLAGGTISGPINDNDDFIIDLDEDNDGANKLSILDGADAEAASITEAGVAYFKDSIELGAAADTTIARTGAGQISVEGSGVVLDSDIGSTVMAATLLKDIVVSGTGLSGGADDVLPGADADVTITIAPDTVAGAFSEGAYANSTVTDADIKDDTIQEPALNVTNAPADNQLLSYNQAGTNFTWVDVGSGDMTKAVYDAGDNGYVDSTDAINISDAGAGTWYPVLSGYDTGTGIVPYTDAALTYDQATGTFGATLFSGSGASLTSLDGENISNDTIDVDSLDWGAFTDLGEGGAVTWGNLAEGELTDSSIVEADIKDGEYSYNYTFLPNGAVLDDSSPPLLTIEESTGTGTPRRYIAKFDPDTDEILYWTFVVPSEMASGNWTATVIWHSADTGANEDCIWAISVSATTEADVDDLEEDAADTSNTESEDVDTNEADRMMSTDIAMSNLDSAAAGDLVTLRFWRDADDSEGDADADALDSDAEFVALRLKIPRK